MALPLQAVTGKRVKLESARVHFKKGLIHYNRLQYLAAVEHFRRAVSVYPEYLTARDYLARAYRMAGFLRPAIRELRALKGISPDNPAVISRLEALQFRYSIDHDVFPFENLVHAGRFNSYLMKHYSFTMPMGMVVDREKNLHIASFDSGKLVTIDMNGQGLAVTTPELNGKLYGVDRYGDRFAVSDFAHDQILFLNERGRVAGKFGGSGSGRGEFHGPEGLSFDKEGNLYVVDSGNHRVQKFNNRGKPILAFGSKGRGKNFFMNPSGVAIAGDRVYVTDTGNSRIIEADSFGNVIKVIRPEGLVKPRGICTRDKLLIAADQEKGILFYDTKKETAHWFESWNQGKNRFVSPVAVTVDDDNFIYCADSKTSRIEIFTDVRNRYSNLDIEVTSTDVSQYPLVALYLSVRNRRGGAVYGLKKKNFRITEDSAPITGFRADYLKNRVSSVSAVLCVDRSLKAKRYHREISWAVDFFLRRMKKNDSVKVMNFNGDYWQGSPFDWSRRRTLRALKKKRYGKGKAAGRALYNAITDLLPRLNRRAVIYVTDGTLYSDSFQRYTPDIIIQYARAHYVPIHVITFKKPDPLLVEIAKKTGGNLIPAGKMDTVKGLYAKIKKSRECRYVLVYTSYKSPAYRGFWSDVRIEVDLKQLKGSEWGGYFVPEREK